MPVVANDPERTVLAKPAEGYAFGHHGELLQGVFEDDRGRLHRGLVPFQLIASGPLHCLRSRRAAISASSRPAGKRHCGLRNWRWRISDILPLVGVSRSRAIFPWDMAMARPRPMSLLQCGRWPPPWARGCCLRQAVRWPLPLKSLQMRSLLNLRRCYSRSGKGWCSSSSAVRCRRLSW